MIITGTFLFMCRNAQNMASVGAIVAFPTASKNTIRRNSDGKEEQRRSNDRRQKTGREKIRRERSDKKPRCGSKDHADLGCSRDKQRNVGMQDQLASADTGSQNALTARKAVIFHLDHHIAFADQRFKSRACSFPAASVSPLRRTPACW